MKLTKNTNAVRIEPKNAPVELWQLRTAYWLGPEPFKLKHSKKEMQDYINFAEKEGCMIFDISEDV